MKDIILILLFCSIGFSSPQAQLSNQDSLIYLHGFNWKIGENKLSSKDLRNEISRFPVTVPYLKKGNTNATLSKLFFAGAALFSLASILNSDEPYYYNNGKRLLSYNLAAATTFAAGIITLKFSLKNRGKAVHLRNKAVLLDSVGGR